MYDKFSICVLEYYDYQVKRWEDEDNVFFEIHSFNSMLETVKNQSYVTIVGIPGSGKSATARHIALGLHKTEGYQIVPVKEIMKIEDYGSPRTPQVFVIDDVLGVHRLCESELYSLMYKYDQEIAHPFMPKTKTIITCRETIYNEAKRYKSYLTKPKNVIHLNSGFHALWEEDKKGILKSHGLDENILPPALLESVTKMFPLLCKLYSAEEKYRNFGINFFKTPVKCIFDDLEKLQVENKLYYAALVLCIMNNGNISLASLQRLEKPFLQMKRDILSSCRVSSQIDNVSILDALTAMNGTYTVQNDHGQVFSFIHESMLHIIAYHYGGKNPEQILQYMNSNYVSRYVKAIPTKQYDEEKQTNITNCDLQNHFLGIGQKHFPLLADRLYRDIEDMELYDVFNNDTLKQHQMCKAFLDLLEGKSFKEVEKLLFRKQSDIAKIANQGDTIVDCQRSSNNPEKARIQRKATTNDTFGLPFFKDLNSSNPSINRFYSPEFGRHCLLFDQRITGRDNTKNVRVISWIIFYGHFKILSYIVDQLEDRKLSVRNILGLDNESDQFTIDARTKDELDACRMEGKRTRELTRLLVLGVYSNSIETVKILLRYTSQDSINNTPQLSCYGPYFKFDSWYTWWRMDTPLSAACSCGNVMMVEELLRANANVNMPFLTCTLESNQLNKLTPLHRATQEGHSTVIDKLLEFGADCNSRDINGRSPLYIAIQEGHFAIVDVLLQYSNVNLCDIEGMSSLHIAAKLGFLFVVENLIANGADCNQCDKYGRSPLYLSSERGYIFIVATLLVHGAGCNKAIGDHSPLHIAIKRGHLSVVELLLEHGAECKTNRNYGMFPLYLAVQNGHWSIVNTLVEHGADFMCEHYPSLLFMCGQKLAWLILQKLNKFDKGKKFERNYELLLALRHGNVYLDSKDDIVFSKGQIQRLHDERGLWMFIKSGDSVEFKNILDTGLNVNIPIQLYNEYYEYEAKPLLHTIIEEMGMRDREEKVKILLDNGADCNTRSTHLIPIFTMDTPSSKLLNFSALERTRQLLSIYRNERVRAVLDSVNNEYEYINTMQELNRHVRRYSV